MSDDPATPPMGNECVICMRLTIDDLQTELNTANSRALRAERTLQKYLDRRGKPILPPTGVSEGIAQELWADSLIEWDSREQVARIINSALAKHRASASHALEIAWGIIANAGGGDWTKETPKWQEAAAKWRDEQLPLMYAPERASDPTLLNAAKAALPLVGHICRNCWDAGCDMGATCRCPCHTFHCPQRDVLSNAIERAPCAPDSADTEMLDWLASYPRSNIEKVRGLLGEDFTMTLRAAITSAIAAEKGEK